MQLVAYGAQDVYLTGNPKITFFKAAYKRHTNFAVEAIEQTFNGQGDFGRQVTCNVNRNGDLITQVYLLVTLSCTGTGESGDKEWGLVKQLGHAMIDEVKVEIGGSQIDKQYGHWMNVWNELTRNPNHDRGFARMIGDVPELTTVTKDHRLANNYTMYVPLQFWFCRNNGLALPLIALQYHDVRLTVQFNKLEDLVVVREGVNTRVTNNECSMNECMLLIDYVYLDSAERKKFAQHTHEYLIEQLQFTGEESITGTNEKVRLNFNHPCKALVWTLRQPKWTDGNCFPAYSENAEVDMERFAKLVFLASRQGLVKVGSSFVITVNNSSTDSEYDVSSPPINSALSGSVLHTLGNLVRANLISASDTETGTNGYQAPADIANVQLLSNPLKASDLNKTVADLVAKVTGTVDTNIVDFLKANSMCVKQPFNYGMTLSGEGNPLSQGKLQLNGHDRFEERRGNYFNYVQSYKYWNNTPVDGVNSYSFALNPMEHQPSGTCNFSRIDNATLSLTFEGADENRGFEAVRTGDLYVYATNYNILRIMSGMGGLAYSN